MGSGPSREQRNDYPVYPQPRYILPPVQPTYPAVEYQQYRPGAMTQMYPPGYYHQQYPNPNIGHRPPFPAPSPSASHPPQQTVTVRNPVNINKGTIRLVKDTENPGFYLLTFSYDAESPGSFNIFLFAKEDATDCSIKPLSPKIFSPIRIPFERGVARAFKQSSGTGFYLDGYDPADLEKEGDDQVCPLVIRAQTNASGSEGTSSSQQNTQSNAAGSEGTSVINENFGAALPKSVNSQVTEAVILKNENGDCKVQVLRQIIWVDGVRYELKELYGVENTGDKSENTEDDEDDFGKECVICMSETRDTAVLPCRHMCMCSGCAEEFKTQMNKCPICRQQVESFLKIKVRKK